MIKLQDAGARLCVETMKSIEDGTAVYTPQDNEIATHTKMIQKSLGKINWSLSAVQIERLIRGLNPWPSAYTYLSGKDIENLEGNGTSGQYGCCTGNSGKGRQTEPCHTDRR